MRRRLGTSDIEVFAVGYGEWPLSNVNRPDEASALKAIRTAVESGADLIDTADAYCLDDNEFGHGERLVRRALDAMGQAGTQVKVATKVGYTRPGGDWIADGRPERIIACCEDSLSRLGVETIDLYQLHHPDPRVPLEDSVGAMARLQEAGKVRLIGLSNVDREQLARACAVVPIDSVQNKCNAWHRVDLDSGFIRYCAEQEITYIPWYPLGGGHAEVTSDPALLELSTKYSVSPYRLLLAWLLSLDDNVLPIPGARKADNIKDSLAAVELRVQGSDLERIGH